MNDWMILQAQECGSYRAEDMIEVLKKTLPKAETAAESIVVVLDWFKAHRDPEIMLVLDDMGHVLLFHGGGTTGYGQINDTHLHAQLQVHLQKLEVAQQYNELERNREDGINKVPTMSRADIVSNVELVWR